jgi:predicted PurR-regulated permease PerM
MTGGGLPTPDPAARPGWPGGALLAVAALWLLREARPVLLPATLALLFTFVLAAPVRALRRRGVDPYVGAALVLGALLGAVALLAWLLAVPALEWWSQLPATLQRLFEALQHWRDALPAAFGGRAGRGAGRLAAVDPIAERIASAGLAFTRLALAEVLSWALSASATVLLLYFLLAAEQGLVARLLEGIPQRRRRALVRGALREAQRDIGLFLGTMSWVNVALGAATGLALAAIGLPSPLPWAAATALLAFIPYLGPAAAAVALLLAGSVAFGVGPRMLAPPAAFLALHAVEANLLSPLVMGRRLRLNPVFVVFSVIAWGWLWGVAGAFIAVPLLLALRAACRRVRPLRALAGWLDGSGNGRAGTGGAAAARPGGTPPA